MNDRDADVIVVGAGIVGCMAAAGLAREYDVLLIDKEGVAAAATGRSAGVIAPAMYYGDLPAVADHLNSFVRTFDGTGQFSFTQRSRIDLKTASEREEARERARQLQDRGFPVKWLEGDALKSFHPQLDLTEFAGKLLFEDTGWVDPYTYATALKETAQKRGASVEIGVSVERLLCAETNGTERERIKGVETDDGIRRAPQVVVAAGHRTRDLVAPYVSLPVKPYRTQCVVLKTDPPIDDDFPIGRIGSQHLYFRPEHNSDLLVGGSHETIDDPAAASTQADESFRLTVAEASTSLFGRFETVELSSHWAGVDTATPDARPIIDAPDEAPDGLVITTGFNGLGIMTAPLVEVLVPTLIEGTSCRLPTAPFALDRFMTRDPDFELYTTSDIN